MKKTKHIGKLMTCGGGLLAVIMLIALSRSFSAVPDGSSPTALSEAINPWSVFASLGMLIFFTGLIAWVSGWFLGARNKRKEQLSGIEERLEKLAMDRAKEAQNQSIKEKPIQPPRD